MAGPSLHLASASPRRRELLRALKIPFSVGVAPVDEEMLEAAYSGPSEELAEHLARAKAAATLAALPDVAAGATLVLTADTTVVLEGEVLGKPQDEAHAIEMLRALRGRAHTVVTGVALAAVGDSDQGIASHYSLHRVAESPVPGAPGTSSNSGGPDLGAGVVRSTAVATRVRMRDYTDAEIAGYAASGDSLDKAGAYGVQHPDFQPVAAVEGCYLAVVGLPMCAVAALLAEASVVTAAPASAHEREGQTPCPWWPLCRPPLPTFRPVQDIK